MLKNKSVILSKLGDKIDDIKMYLDNDTNKDMFELYLDELYSSMEKVIDEL